MSEPGRVASKRAGDWSGVAQRGNGFRPVAGPRTVAAGQKRLLIISTAQAAQASWDQRRSTTRAW
jgi:hypothetical protein